MSKVFITGHKGLLGSACVRLFTSLGHSVYTTPRRLDDLASCRYAMAESEADILIHCAARVGGIAENKAEPIAFLQDNLRIQTNVFSAAFEAGVQHLVFAGTSCMYPKHAEMPVKEECLLTGKLEPDVEAYAIAKIAGWRQVKAYRETHGLNWTTVAPCNLYGPCFDDITEVMTPIGPRLVKDIEVGDDVFTLDQSTGTSRVTKVIQKQVNPVSEWFVFKNSKVDFRVTPEHRMFVRPSSSKGYQFRKAEWFRTRAGKSGQVGFHPSVPFAFNDEGKPNIIDLSSYFDDRHVPVGTEEVRDSKFSRSKPYPVKYSMADLAEFVGWFVSEGHFANVSSDGEPPRGQIRIAQCSVANPQNVKRIKELLVRMGIFSGFYGDQFYLTNRLLFNFLSDVTGFGSRKIGIKKEWITSLTKESMGLLHEALMSGDGNKHGGRYNTASEYLKDSFIFLSFLIGKRITYSKMDQSGVWRIGIKKKNQPGSIKHRDISIETQASVSYCFTAERDNIIFAGRNGMFNWVGQCDSYGERKAHVIPALISKLYESHRTGKPFEVWGDGKQVREFLHADDCASAIYHVLTERPNFDLINVGPGYGTSIAELCATLFSVAGCPPVVKWKTDGPRGIEKKTFNIDRIKGHTSWAPKTSLEEGLKQVWREYVISKEA